MARVKTWHWAALGVAVFLLAGRRGKNATVLDVARSFPDGGTYAFSGSGTPIAIVHKGEQILAKGEGVYCSGFTFAVATEAAKKLGLLADKSVDQLKRFHRDWYGSGGDTEQLSGPALQRLGIGGPVATDDAKPGDFVQFWRGRGNGHSVVFVDWLRDAAGQKIGLKYRSAQGNGVGDNQERFSGSGGDVIRSRTYFSRLA